MFPANRGHTPIERLRTLACFETKSTTLLNIQPGKAVEGVEVASDHVCGAIEVYLRVRAFFHTTAYVCIADPTMLDFKTEMTESENRCSRSVGAPIRGESRPARFFMYAWAQTSHAPAEHMRMYTETKLNKLVHTGSLFLGILFDLPLSQRRRPDWRTRHSGRLLSF